MIAKDASRLILYQGIIFGQFVSSKIFRQFILIS
jgi:hypothetical protein